MRSAAEMDAGLRDDARDPRHGLDCRAVDRPRDDAEAKSTLRHLASVLNAEPPREPRKRTPEQRDADEATDRAHLAVIIAHLYALGHTGIDATGGPRATLDRYRNVQQPPQGGAPPGWGDD